MKKLLLTATVFLTLGFCSIQAQSWETLEMDSLIAVKFPQYPVTRDTLGQTFYVFSDSLGSYMATSRNTNQKDFELSPQGLPKFYEGFINGMLESTHGKVIYKKEILIEGLKGIEILWHSNQKPNLPGVRYTRAVYVNDHIYSFNFWTTQQQEKRTSVNRKRFFESVSVLPHAKAHLKQYTISDEEKSSRRAYELGKISGKLFMWVLVIAGAVFLFKKLVTI